MIRFCDKEVYCVMYDSLDRRELRSYFLKGHINDIVCILDEAGGYQGMITWHSLLGHDDIYEAVKQEYVLLDGNIWENGREYFCHNRAGSGDVELLPVLNKEHRLVCFAYQDEEADRELRMLEEMDCHDDARDFKDIYPEYDCVTVYGCNELAYCFVKYLEHRGVEVNVAGEIWSELGSWEWHGALDYKNYLVYAEGTWKKSGDLKENLLRSVSAEFECIDYIYEENVKEGIIKDAECSFAELAERLRKEREIVIRGIDANAQDAYDLLLANGVDVYCFMTEFGQNGRRLFGKPVLDRLEVMNCLERPVFIESTTVNSTWGLGDVDRYHYAGYRRNDQYFLLRDYIEIPQNNLKNALKGKRLVLAGDIHLCSRLYRCFGDMEIAGYWNILGENRHGSSRMPELNKNEIEENDICLLVFPEYFDFHGLKGEWKLCQLREKCAKYTEKLKEYNVSNYTDYFSRCSRFLRLEEDKLKYGNLDLKPMSIIIGAMDDHSGNNLFRDLLDGHPNVISINYSFLNNNLYTVCIRLAEEESSSILSLFWDIYEGEAGRDGIVKDFPRKEDFDYKMKKLLQLGTKFTSQELFVMFHMAYSYMWGNDVNDMNNMMIYWEPHHVNRKLTREFAEWLGGEEQQGHTIDIVRNWCMKAGSRLKNNRGEQRMRAFACSILYYPKENMERKKAYDYWDEIEIRFEDLKCRPREILTEVCRKTGIPWSDTLLETTRHGKISSYMNGTSGFDLKPVFNNHEDIFSAYDRMRLSLIAAPWQKKYGYPYVNCLDFTRVELQEMFLKKFRMEGLLYNFSNSEDRVEYYLYVQKGLRNRLWEIRKLELMEREEK